MTTSGISTKGTAAPARRLSLGLGRSDLGLVLVAHDEDGLAALLLGDREQEMMDTLATSFPDASFAPAGAAARQMLAAAIDLIADPARPAGLPFALGGTPFQTKVWKALLEIPVGEVRSYAQIARRIGQPRATRAVAGACAANRLAVVVPCHRVVRGDGALSGYRWGAWRKAALLERESALSVSC